MSLYPRGGQIQGSVLGELVTKAPQNLPQTAGATLYTVSNGAVLIQALLGRVTTTIQNQTCTLSLGVVVTGGNSLPTAIATATSIQALAIGEWLQPTPSAGAAGALTNSQAPFLTTAWSPYLASPGTITWTTSASNTGQAEWYLWYVPLDQGATVS